MKTIFLIFATFLISACQASHDAPKPIQGPRPGTPVDSPGNNPAPSPDPVVPGPVTFKAVQDAFFTQKCAGCHRQPRTPDEEGRFPRGGVDLSSFTALLSEPGMVVPGQPMESLVYTVVLSDEMPRNRPLLQTEKDLIRKWIEDGALE